VRTEASTGAVDLVHGAGEYTASARRSAFLLDAVDSLRSDVKSLKAAFAKQAPRVLIGSGSTASQSFLAKAVHLFADKAKVPLTITYRGIGSGSGVREIINSGGGYAPAVNFAW
jgi:ABC-type phosphate transport system substrate-binding protein